METYIIIVIIFGIIALLILCSLFFINRLSLLENEMETSFIPIKKYLEERSLLLEKISTLIDNNLESEYELKKEINKIKLKIDNIQKSQDGILTLKESDEVLIKFNNLDELYTKLKNNKEYLSLKEEYLKNENRINYSIDNYNKGVKNYNNYKENKIVKMIDKIMHFPEYTYYKK